jgi:hypothetical protein
MIQQLVGNANQTKSTILTEEINPGKDEIQYSTNSSKQRISAHYLHAKEFHCVPTSSRLIEYCIVMPESNEIELCTHDDTKALNYRSFV